MNLRKLWKEVKENVGMEEEKGKGRKKGKWKKWRKKLDILPVAGYATSLWARALAPGEAKFAFWTKLLNPTYKQTNIE